MSSLFSASTIILIEIATALSAISGYFLYRFIRSNRTLNSTLSGLAKKINHKRESRKSMLKEFLEETCNYQGEEAQKMADEMVKKERMFYATLMNIYKHRDNNALKDLDQTTEEITNAYKQLLTVSAKAVTDSMQETINKKTHKLSGTIDTLTEKNQELAKELSQLQHEMDMTVNEFTSAFQREQQEKQQQEQAQAQASTSNDEAAAAQSSENSEESAAVEILETPDETPIDNSENIDASSVTEDNNEAIDDSEKAEDISIKETQNNGDAIDSEESSSNTEELAELDDAPSPVELTAEAEPMPELDSEPDSETEPRSETEAATTEDNNEGDNPEKDTLTESLSELDENPEEITTNTENNNEVSTETINSDLMEGLDDLADALDNLKEADDENKASPAA